MAISIEMLFDIPQQEIASRIRNCLNRCSSASIISGFLTPSGVGSLAAPIKTRPTILKRLVIGSATYPGFEALDQLISWGVPQQDIRVHLGHTRASGTRKHPFVRHHPMLHSKIFYLEFEKGLACAFVGSHNVTSFALQGLNGEAGILLEGPRDTVEFGRIRRHIDEAYDQAVPYSSGMKEAFAWWTREFLEGLQAEIGLPHDWTSVRTILIFAQATPSDRPKIGEHLYFELPAGIAIESLKTEVHLFLFSSLPPTPWETMQRLPSASAHYTCKVIGADNLQGNREVEAHWLVEELPPLTLRKVPSGIHRPAPTSGMQQVRAEVNSLAVAGFEYAFERERVAWDPLFADEDRTELHPVGASTEPFPISDAPWIKESREPWKLVSGLVHREGPAPEKDAAALIFAKPESGSFILVSLRRRARNDE